jgi:predicted amidohydrolase
LKVFPGKLLTLTNKLKGDRTMNENENKVVFELLCLYRDYKNVFPDVILNYYHTKPSGHLELDKVKEILQQFKKNPGKKLFALLFHWLKKVDEALNGKPVEEFIYENGILLTGESFWKAFSLVPGEYPFANLRVIRMQTDEIERYKKTPKINFSSDESLNIAACILGQEAITQFGGKANLSGNQYGLYARSISNPDQLARELTSCLEWAKNNDADVVLFPELSIDEKGAEVIENWIKDNDVKLDEIPQIIVAGSFYYEVDGNLRNRSPIYFIDKKSTGEPFYKTYYDKHVPFSMTVPKDISKCPSSLKKLFEEAKAAGANVIVEDFISSNSITLVNTSKGMFGFAICRDVLDLAGIGNPLEHYLNFADFIMIISFNEGKTVLFEAQGEDLARWHNCAVTYVNAKQAVPNFDNNSEVKMSFSIYPYDESSSAISGEIYYAKPLQDKFGEIKIKKVPPNGNILYEIKNTPGKN